MRCNVGIDPFFLADQHLIAEYRELPMVIGSLRSNNWIVKSPIPDVFNLGKGHINFFKNKLLYLARRHKVVINEMKKRNFKCDVLDISNTNNFDVKYVNDWVPTMKDSYLLRCRIDYKLRLKPEFYKHYSKPIISMETFIKTIYNSPLYEV